MNKLVSTEIICTIGPVSLNSDTLSAFQELGVTLLRINLSHTRVDELADLIEYVQSICSIPICLDTEGAQKFGKATSENVGKRFAVILDGVVITAPVIRSPITGGSGIISGNFTSQDATDLAVLLRAGALPAPLLIVE